MRDLRAILITGVAGFIGYSLARSLLCDNQEPPVRVLGIDNLNSYYSVALKRARLAQLEELDQFEFRELDVADHQALRDLVLEQRPNVVIHLAAQAGVRYSLENPFAYANSNLLGHLSVLEACRNADPRPRLVYASSSSVYGANTKLPFSESDACDRPVSLYAATKRADELMSESYAHLYGLEQIGLRFFTVYGPWGRPDMAYWTFTEKILSGDPIPIFNNGRQKRDFTYVDDIIDGVIACALRPARFEAALAHRIYNIGNSRSEPLLRFIDVLEDAIGKRAVRDFRPAAPGDVEETFADIQEITREYGYQPKTTIEEGLPKFVAWYRNFASA